MMANLTKKTEKELKKDLVEKRKQIREFRFNIAGSNLKDVKGSAKLKKDIARILTELNARTK